MSSQSAARLLAVLLLAPALNAQTADAVAGKLDRAVRQCPQVTIFDDVAARVDGSAVLLTGKVTSPLKKEELEKRVARIDGVGEVRNEIAVLPPLTSDDDLRHRVARAIYGNPSFWPYAAMANPPIHIIVERGHVILRGTVGSNTERTMARSLATGLGELSLTNELRAER
jgi:hyperosmotically inducible periplasmic protein